MAVRVGDSVPKTGMLKALLQASVLMGCLWDCPESAVTAMGLLDPCRSRSRVRMRSLMGRDS